MSLPMRFHAEFKELMEISKPDHSYSHFPTPLVHAPSIQDFKEVFEVIKSFASDKLEVKRIDTTGCSMW